MKVYAFVSCVVGVKLTHLFHFSPVVTASPEWANIRAESRYIQSEKPGVIFRSALILESIDGKQLAWDKRFENRSSEEVERIKKALTRNVGKTIFVETLFSISDNHIFCHVMYYNNFNHCIFRSATHQKKKQQQKFVRNIFLFRLTTIQSFHRETNVALLRRFYTKPFVKLCEAVAKTLQKSSSGLSFAS